jgi:hypothetical protein
MLMDTNHTDPNPSISTNPLQYYLEHIIPSLMNPFKHDTHPMSLPGYPLFPFLSSDNLDTTQTPECTKDKYNVKIIKRKVSPKVSPTTYIGQRLEERKERRG